jgi:hypothetical protein
MATTPTPDQAPDQAPTPDPTPDANNLSEIIGGENNTQTTGGTKVKRMTGRWAIIITVSTAAYLFPWGLASILVNQPKKQAPKIQGISREQPGSLFISDNNLDQTDPSLKEVLEPILLAERLNKAICQLVIANPSMAQKLRATPMTEIDAILEESFGEEGKKTAIAARASAVRWVGSAGPWGLFLLPEDRVLSEEEAKNNIPFGSYHINGGNEKTRYLTEIKLNSVLYQLLETKTIDKGSLTTTTKPITVLLRAAVKAKIMKPSGCPDIIATSQSCEINYQPALGLFLSKDGAQELSDLKKSVDEKAKIQEK